MTEFTQHTPGTFSWVDLATTDAEAAKKFYGELFGWRWVDMPAGTSSVYTMLQKNGKNVAGLYQQTPDQLGMPSYWASYISVADALATANKAKSLGGTVLVEPFDVMGEGWMGVIQDPTGAAVGLWQPGNHIGAQMCHEPGSFTWAELMTHDLSKATGFYTQLLDWSHQVYPMDTMDYTVFMAGTEQRAGMMKIQPEWGEVPPNWCIYFAVENCDATVEKAVSLGGKMEMAPTEAAGVGRFALLQDPQGAYFCVIALAAMA